jgi:hypothetical protein
MSTCKKLRFEKIETNTLEANIKFIHTTNQNSALPSLEGEEEKRTLIVGQLARKYALA